ncbi:low affinity immunoglobulin gamma Fc region receptor II-a-like [Thunnus albacares]|uniref:low affinity immunoglobulin gamma Fc region receptor II-a-like n=1 Tax=Thunnus albacares TaxID=8236 RepID=UPI001CF704CB|nr:low affinity immunoglobulin gamma Fc region receptor II-a-like [Thunnus albacares]
MYLSVCLVLLLHILSWVFTRLFCPLTLSVSQQQVRMEVTALSLLLLMSPWDSGQAQVSVTVHPERSQFFKYDSFSVSCEEEEMTEWRVMKRMEDGEVHPCPLSCSVIAAFPATDSGVYWCETGVGASSSAINITVTAGSVILESPVYPVMEGDNVTLNCRHRVSCDRPINFYKDGYLIQNSTTGNMTVHNVTKSDEGLYKCDVCGFEESPQSWLTVRAPSEGQDPPAPLLPVFTLVRHLVVGTPYLLSTIILGLIYRDRARARHANKARRKCNDVIMEMAA